MKLDKRIKTLKDIITCFDEDRTRAEKYIGQNGYFTDDIMEFGDLESCTYGELESYIIGEDYPFNCGNGDAISHALFIPESVLKPKKKKCRPFTMEEFKSEFDIGKPIKFRKKDDTRGERYVLLLGYGLEECNKSIFDTVLIGHFSYSLDELFNEYEYKTNDVWKPFGVEEC